MSSTSAFVHPCELELMTTSGCHLCVKAVEILIQVLDPDRFFVELVDIAYEDELMERYAVKIPVLVCREQKKELEWPFDHAQLSAFVNGLLTVSTTPR